MMLGLTHVMAVLGLATTLTFATGVRADSEVWATCGPFKGVSHVAQGVGVNKVQVGGQMAGLAGETTLVYDPARDEQPFDVVNDGADGSRSVVSEGAEIAALEPSDGGLMLTALYRNGVIETFHFLGPTLVYAQSESTADLVTTSTYVATCTWSH